MRASVSASIATMKPFLLVFAACFPHRLVMRRGEQTVAPFGLPLVAGDAPPHRDGSRSAE